MKRIVSQFLPIKLRQPGIMSISHVLLEGIVDCYTQWLIYRAKNITTMHRNGQVCYLRKMLNDDFDITQRRIRIVDGNQFSRMYIYTTGEQKSNYLGKKYLRKSSDHADTSVDFIVFVPMGIEFNMDDIKAKINYYRLASKRYEIRYE